MADPQEIAPNYAKAGVSLQAGDEASDTAFQISQASWAVRAGKYGEPEVFSEGFRGVRGNALGRLFELQLEFPDAVFIDDMCSDGTGRKPAVPQRIGRHDTIGEDLGAMVFDDAAAKGGEPVSMTNTFIVNRLPRDDDHLQKRERLTRWHAEVMQGVNSGAVKAGAVVTNGETAEHGDSVGGYGEFRYDLIATAKWVALQERLLDGSKAEEGQAFVALEDISNGCNGYSLLLEGLEDILGYEWHHQEFVDDETAETHNWGEELCLPSTIYAGLFVDLHGGYDPNRQPKADVSLLTHHTGSGMLGKIASKLAGLGLGVELDNLFLPTPSMRAFQRLAGIDDEEMYRVFHMGQRGGVITPDPDRVISTAAEHGIRGQVAGYVTDKTELVLTSRGNDNAGKLRVPIPQ